MKKLTTEEFIDKAIKIHSSTYDYSKVVYQNTKTAVNIICQKHGEFLQNPVIHLGGSGCPKCWGNRCTSKESFIEKSNIIHKNKYDYSKVIYLGSKEKVCIICLEHGDFWQTTNNHLKGKGCPVCGRLKCDLARIKSKDSFIDDCHIIHNYKYDYTLVNYKTRKDKIKIVCPIHGEFIQEASSHLAGHGCPLCSWEILSEDRAFSWEFVKEQCKEIHKGLYSYPNQEYKNSRSKIEIICKNHGVFLQSITNHLQGQGCPICRSSKGELLIHNWLKENNIPFRTQFELITTEIARNTNLMKIDFFVKFNNKQYFIEFDGIQHFQYVPIFHKGGIIDFEKEQRRDKILNEFCELHKDKITLVRFNYKQNNEEIIKELNKIFIN